LSYATHKRKWSKCKKCLLCKVRHKIILGRGHIPCDILFIGEAPGVSEDRLGRPFVGPAGKLLDRIIAEALPEARVAFTNLIACIPKDQDGKMEEPPLKSVKRCRSRLDEFVHLAKPQLIVCIGKLAAKHYNQVNVPQVSIVHPAAILRAEPYQKGFAIQETVVTLIDAYEQHLVPF